MLAAEYLLESHDVLIDWAEAVSLSSRDGYKHVVIQKAANMLAQSDPKRASQWIEGFLDRDYSRGVPGLIAKRWIERGDPAAAMEWLLGFSDDQIRSNSVSGAMSRWAELDLKAAQNWLRPSTPRKELDPTVEAMVMHDFRADPESALEWAGQVHDPELRRKLIVGTGRYWLNIEPIPAGRWVEDSEYAEEIRSEVWQEPTKPKRQPAVTEHRVSESRLETIHEFDRVKEA